MPLTEPAVPRNRHTGLLFTVAARTVVPDHYGPLDLDLALTALIPPGQADPYRRR